MKSAITEPTTMVTDYLVAAEALYLWWQLRQDASGPSRVAEAWWGRAFLATAFAALVGGTTHGFDLFLGGTTWLVLWKTTVYSLAVASLCLLVAALISAFRGRSRQVLIALACAKFLIYIGFLTQIEDLDFSHFRYAIYDYGTSMALVFVLQLWAWWRQRSAAAPWILGGILVSTVAAQIQMAGFGLHRHFNHNDIFHVIQMLALWLLYRGGLQLRDAE